MTNEIPTNMGFSENFLIEMGRMGGSVSVIAILELAVIVILTIFVANKVSYMCGQMDMFLQNINAIMSKLIDKIGNNGSKKNNNGGYPNAS